MALAYVTLGASFPAQQSENQHIVIDHEYSPAYVVYIGDPLFG